MLRQGLTAVATLALAAGWAQVWAADAPAAGGGQTPLQIEAAAAKGTLKNPYTDDKRTSSSRATSCSSTTAATAAMAAPAVAACARR